MAVAATEEREGHASTSMTSQQLPREPIRELGPMGRRTMPAGQALIVIIVALLLGAMLNVQSLSRAADNQAPGFQRNASQVLVWPFEQVSGLLGLDQPRALLSERLGREVDAGSGGQAVAVAPEVGSALGGDALAGAAALAGREAVDTSLGSAIALPSGDIAAVLEDIGDVPALSDRLQGPFTLEDPLRVAVIGDSLTEQIGPTLVARLARPGVPGVGTHDFTYSSGLSRPDFYDWPARAAQLDEEQDPDIWVVMMGANDGQDVIDADGRFRQLGTDEWEAIYRSRVGGLMDLLIRDGSAVIWIGQPNMRDPEFDETMAYVSSLYADEAASRAFVSYVDARRIFAGEDGGYADYLPAGDGQLTQMRLSDGIHLTRSGAERLVTQILPLLPVETEVVAPES